MEAPAAHHTRLSTKTARTPSAESEGFEKVMLRSSRLDVNSGILIGRDVKKSCFGARGLM